MKLFKILICSFFTFNLFAFKYSPMSLSLFPNDNLKSSIVYLENDSSSPIAISVTIAKRLMDKTGHEENPEVVDDFDVYPNQMIIPSFEKRSVKISWHGKDLDKDEKAYRIIAEQLPIDIEKSKSKKKGSVKILLRYVGALYVDPGKTQSEVKLKKFEVKDKMLNFLFENSGNKHQVLSNLKLNFKKDKEKEIKVTPADLKNFSGENILAKSEREFNIPMNELFKKIDSTFQVSFSFDQD